MIDINLIKQYWKIKEDEMDFTFKKNVEEMNTSKQQVRDKNYIKIHEEIKKDLINLFERKPTNQSLKNTLTRRLWSMYMAGYRNGIKNK